MKFFRELLFNTAATYRLQPRYCRLATCVGLAAVAAGIGLVYAAAHLLAYVLGESLSARASPLWIGLFLLAIPLSFYVAMVVVAGAFGLVMVLTGRFTPAEAMHYALRSRYPLRWFVKGDA